MEATKTISIGQRFTRLVVLQRAAKHGKGRHRVWQCQCDCGAVINIPSHHLKSGHTKSCGCIRAESQRAQLAGQRFGKLLVLKQVTQIPRPVFWECQCDCGNIVVVRASSLQKGDNKSCGCLHKKDLTGQKFGRLLVLEDAGRTKSKDVLWKCQCDCGNTNKVTTTNLQSGTTKSCGCYNRERTAESNSGENHPNWKGGITPTFRVIRNCTQYKNWRFSVFQRDNFTCQKCNQLRGNINAHHIIPFSKIMEEHSITTLEEAEACEALWNISNGVTLCGGCHQQIHRGSHIEPGSI